MRSLMVLVTLTTLALLAGCDDEYCGDYECNGGETSQTCSLDCGSPPPPPAECGNGKCETGEYNFSCPADCGANPPPPPPGCGDGFCDASRETSGSCPADCGSVDPCDVPISAGPVYLGVPEMPQWCQNWCWAAVITMVAHYEGMPDVKECELASMKAGFTTFACCEQSACLYYGACDRPGSDQEMNHILNQILGIDSQLAYRALTEQELQIELSNLRPVIVGYLSSFSGHVVIVDAFSGTDIPAPYLPYYHVYDPYNGGFDVTYDQLRNGYMGGGQSWNWGKSWHHLTTDPQCGG